MWPTAAMSRYLTITVCLFTLTLFITAGVYAQSATDASTPPGQAPGAPAGSFALSGFDNVNMFNGNLNFALPLLKIGGRGEVGYTVTLPIERRWIGDRVDPWTVYPGFNWWSASPGYAPGILQGRQMSEGCFDIWQVTAGTTRLTFTMPDNTEYELIDQIYGGQPANSNCFDYQFNPENGVSRGTTFVTRDGTSATFISDTVIKDVMYSTSSPWIIYPTGYLMLRDGTRYRIVSGRVEWMRDSNGNKLTFTYSSNPTLITSVTDSLNRVVTFDYGVSDPVCGTCDRINFKGVGGASRKIWIAYTAMGSALVSGQTIKKLGGPTGLFPEMNGSTISDFNPGVYSKVILPDAVRSYEFFYNSYGELAKVKLPTGGVVTYEWGAGLASGPASGVAAPSEIYRRVLERRVYTSDGGSLVEFTSFGRHDNAYGPADGSAWMKSYDTNGTTILKQSKHTFIDGPLSYTDEGGMWLPPLLVGREKQTEDYNTAGTTVLKRVAHTWATGGTLAGTPTNPRVTQTLLTLEPASANLVSKQTFSYDTYNNQTDLYEYGFGAGAAGSLVRRTHTDFLTTNPVNGTNYATTSTIHLRALPTQKQVFDGGGVERARSTFEYDNYAAVANHAGLVNRTNISGLDSGFTTSYTQRGNTTATTRHFFNTSGGATGSISTYQQFDIAGNTVKNIDGRGFATDFDFSDRFGAADGNAQANSGATELGSQVSYAFATAITNPLAHVAYTQYDYYLGQPVDTEDPNGSLSSFYYADALDRPTQVRRGVGTAVASQTTFAYDDANKIITTSNDLNTFGDNVLVSKMLYDGLGRTTETRKYEGGSNYIVTQTEYDALNRAFRSSNPFRPWQSQTAVWTTTGFDALGRVISVATPDNATVSTSYSGNATTVTDPAGKVRKTITDALGRVTDVYEDPSGVNYQTTYNYDVLDNVVKITSGTQQRFFMYDSMKRLIRTKSPEQSANAGLALTDPISGNSAWCMAYQYDSNGNLTQKTDARGVVSTYVYDALNRNTTLDQSDTAINPDVKRFYDGATNGKGRPWYFYSGGDFSTGANVDHTSIDSYDILGRPLVQRQLFKFNSIWSPTYQTSRTYNLAGGVTSQNYPSARSVSYTYDSAGRTSSVTGTLGDGLNRTYSTGATYSQWGSLSFEQFGTNIPMYNKIHYNVRGQVYDVRASNLGDEWGGELGALVNHYSTVWVHGGSGADNNGNVLMSQTIINGTYYEDRYSYDSLNRITAVNEFQNGATQTFSQQYSYDRWGNRTINPASWGTGINIKQFTVDTTNNRLGVPGGQPGTMSYDAAGNLTTDTYTSFGSRTYDAENKMTAAQDNLAGWSYYTYDADGSRTRRKIGSQETWQIYGFDKELIAEYAASAGPGNPQKENVYRNGQLLVSTTGPSCGAGYIGTKSWGATNGSIGHNTGQQEGTDWAAYVSSHGAGHMVYGPYDTSFGKGRHQAQFQLQVDNNSGNDVVATLDVVTEFGVNILAQKQIKRSDFSAANTWQWFNVDFDHPCFGYVEARLYWHDNTNLKYRETRITSSGSGGAIVYWMVADHRGTPRMIFDQAGSYQKVKRHDYLPYGEELFAGAGGRTTGLGYTGGDGIRQQFTGKERDIETGLDYFDARYYSSTQGRFTSPDPLYFTARRIGDPQQLNLYSYVRNSPLRMIDPDGRDGRVINAAGQPADQPTREQVQRDLQRIAPGTTVDNQGRIRKAGFFRRVFNHLTGRGAGTALVTRIVNSRFTTTIQVVPGAGGGGGVTAPTNAAGSLAGQRSNATIQYDPNATTGLPTRMPDANGNVTDTSPIQNQATNSALTLGHELIHADHIMQGGMNWGMTNHTFYEGTQHYQETWLSEEFRTVGFSGFVRRGDTTENKLRKQLGLNPRAAYTPGITWNPIP